MIWVLIANTNTGRFYTYNKNRSHLLLLKKINHPEIKLKSSESLTSDRPGHYHTSNTARGAYSPQTDPKEVEINNFAKELADHLDVSRKTNEFDQLIIIAPPYMNGLVFQELSKYVKEQVTNRIQKDVLQLSDRELVEFLKEHIQFANED